MRILLIEDDQVSLEMLAFLLQCKPHEVADHVWSADKTDGASPLLFNWEASVPLVVLRLRGIRCDEFAPYLKQLFPHTTIIQLTVETVKEAVRHVSENAHFSHPPSYSNGLLATLN